MSTPENRHRFPQRGVAVLLSTALALGLAACGGGGSSTDSHSLSEAEAASATTPSGTDVSDRSGAPVPGTTTQPASTEGRLLASNCFQCHGTLGTGGFDAIRGSKASEVLEYMTKTANRDIMAAHAQGYTREQLQKIITYLQQ